MSSSPRSARGRTAGTAALLLAPILAGAAAPPPPPFVEADDVGLDFVHVNGRHGELYFVENVGAGAALFDYDGDGDLDLYLVQGEALGPEARRQGASDRLLRNDLTRDADGRPVLRFTDVTAAAGLAEGEYGMGVAAGDFDGDGHVDLYVTNWGPNRLWRNRGDGTFEDVTAASGTGEPRWSVSATFVDYDRDGDLDLFVGNYVAFSYAVHKVCRNESGLRDYCTPLAFAAESDRLFENRGDGTFADATRAAGLDRVEPAGALGVVAADLDGDGWVDLYVANDLAPNHLWLNRGDGTFREEALLAGCAVDGQGRAQASMGVDAADFDGDGDDDLFLTHLTGESNTLYVNDGSGIFRDGSIAAGLAAPSLPFTGFGTAFIDYDGDGRLDLLAANGAVRQIEALARAGDPYPLHQTNQLFRNLGPGADGRVRFADASTAAGEAFARSEVTRGAAFGDVDNDGDLDVVLTNNGGPVRLLLNQRDRLPDHRWLGLRLVSGGRDALGARVAVHLAGGGEPLWRRARADGSYASANDPRVLVALGAAAAVERVVVLWPSGRREAFDPPPLGAYATVVEGSGRAPAAAGEDEPGEAPPGGAPQGEARQGEARR